MAVLRSPFLIGGWSLLLLGAYQWFAWMVAASLAYKWKILDA